MDELYNTLPMDKVDSLEDLVPIGPSLVKVNKLIMWFLFLILRFVRVRKLLIIFPTPEKKGLLLVIIFDRKPKLFV